MGMSKTEINLRRLLSAAPNQQNQSKLMHVRLSLSLFSIFFYLICKLVVVEEEANEEDVI